MKIWLAPSLAVLAACAHQISPSIEEAQAIMTPLAYEQEIERKCGWEEKTADADRFLKALSGQARSEAGKVLSAIKREVSEGEAEYVCTVELFESTRQRADAARATWTQLEKMP